MVQGSDQLTSKLLAKNNVDVMPFLTHILPGNYNNPTAQFATSLGFYNNDLELMDNFMDTTNNLSSLYRGGGETNISSFGKNYPSFYSESSSERSETPNSTISSFFSAAPSAPSNQSLIVNNSTGDQLYESSASSTSSTSTTIQDHQVVEGDQASDDGKKSDPKGKSAYQPKTSGGKKSASPATSPSSSSSSSSGQKTAKKEDSYCGYVESFPYYYKLNRLYNALALQKMQTERLKKSGLLNNSPAANSPLAMGGLSPVNVRPAASKLISTSLASSPNKFNATSPSSTPPPVPSAIGVSPARNLTLPLPQQSPKNQHNKYSSNPAVKSKQSPNGYPMSPTNAAISFANHHKSTTNSKSSRQMVSTYPNQPTNLDYTLLQSLSLNQPLPPPPSTSNSALSANFNASAAAYNNSFFQIPPLFNQPQQQQQQQQQSGHSFPTQNNTFSNSSFFTGQDLLKTGN